MNTILTILIPASQSNNKIIPNMSITMSTPPSLSSERYPSSLGVIDAD